MQNQTNQKKKKKEKKEKKRINNNGNNNKQRNKRSPPPPPPPPDYNTDIVVTTVVNNYPLVGFHETDLSCQNATGCIRNSAPMCVIVDSFLFLNFYYFFALPTCPTVVTESCLWTSVMSTQCWGFQQIAHPPSFIKKVHQKVVSSTTDSRRLSRCRGMHDDTPAARHDQT